MAQMAKAAELRMRAECANQAADAVEAADAAQAELAELRSSIDSQMDAQLGFVLVQRQVRAVRAHAASIDQAQTSPEPPATCHATAHCH